MKRQKYHGQNRGNNHKGGRGSKRGRGQIRGGKVQQSDKLYSEKMGRQLQPDEIAVLAREVERLSQKEKDLIEREKRLKSWEESAKSGGNAGEKAAITRGQQLWKKAQNGMKGVTLSEKLRNAERSIAILASRLEKAGLSTDVHGNEMSSNKELAKLREENEALAMKLQLANGRSAGADPAKKAAAAADKRARDLKAALDTLKGEYIKLKKELELSGSAGKSARQELHDLKEKCKHQEQLLAEMQNKLKIKDRQNAEEELKLISEKMQKLLNEKKNLKERLKGAETDSARLRVQLEEHRSKLKQLSIQRQNIDGASNEKLKKLDEHFKNEKNKVKELNEKLEEVNARVNRLSELQEKLKKKESELNKERLDKENLLKRIQRQEERNKDLEEDLKTAEEEKETMREATRSTADAAAVSIESVKQVVTSLKEELKVVRQKNEKLTAALDGQVKEAEKYKDKIKDLELASAEHKDFNNHSLELHAQIQSLKKELKEKTEEISSMKTTHISELEKMRSELNREVESLKKSFGSEKQQLASERDKEVKKLKNEIQKILQSQSDSESDSQERNNEISTLKARISELEANLSQLNIENTSLKENLDKQSTLVHESKEYVSGLRKDVSELSHQLKVMETKYKAGIETVKKHKDEAHAKSLEVSSKSARINTLNKDIKKLQDLLSVEKQKFQSVLQEQVDESKETENLLRQDISLLSEQLSSLIENGEAFKRNVNKRETQYKKQIEELQNVRKQDIAEFSKVRKAATAWKKKASKGKSKDNFPKENINHKKPSTAGPKSSTVSDRKRITTNKSSEFDNIQNKGRNNGRLFSRGRDIKSQQYQCEQAANNSVPKLPSLSEKMPATSKKANIVEERDFLDDRNIADGLTLGGIKSRKDGLHYKVRKRAQEYIPHTPPRKVTDDAEKGRYEPN